MITATPTSTGTVPAPRPEVDPGSPAQPPPRGPLDPTRASARRGFALLALLALVALVAIVGGVYYVLSPVRVELSVDGQTQSIETRSGSVADLLADQGIVVTDADLVDPPLAAELAEGTTITVSYARPVTLVIDGVETAHVTTRLTVGDALQALSAPTDGAAVLAPLSDAVPRGGATIEIITPKPVTLDVGGQPSSVTSTAKTVGDLLAAEGIVLSPTDALTPPGETPVTSAMTITVTRIRIENETRTEPVAHETIERDDADLAIGTRKVVTNGTDGAQEVTYAVTYTNDQISDQVVVAATVTTEPVTEVVAVGTKPVVAAPKAVDPGSAGGAAADLNWAALAQCESSGNPKAVNPAGYYGLYQFSKATWASVGGSGNPADASAAEQTERAQILYNRSGAGQWPHCGPRLFT